MTDIDRNGEQPTCSSWPPEPWFIRRAPEHWKLCLLYACAWLGSFCWAAIVFSGFWCLVALPLALAAFSPHLRISQVVLWFHRLIGPKWFLTAYTAVMLPMALLITYGMNLCIYVRVHHGRKYFDFPKRREGYPLTSTAPNQRNHPAE
jgi:hypothetical protein